MNNKKTKNENANRNNNLTEIVNDIVEDIINYENLSFNEKFELLNKKVSNFVSDKNKITKTKFRKYYDLFINSKEKMESQEISKKRKEYEKVLLKAYILAKYDLNRKQLDESLVLLFEDIIEKLKDEKDDEKFVKTFENLSLFLEAVATNLKE